MPRTNVVGTTTSPGSGAQRCAQADEREHRTDSTGRPATATATGVTAHKAKHYCRNPRCRSRLLEPVENERRAFCTRGCHESFYRNRCRVCEEPLRKDGGRDAGRRYCRPPNDCKAEAAKWPEKYGDGVWAALPEAKIGSAHSTGLKTLRRRADGVWAVFPSSYAKSAHFTGLKSGDRTDRPRHRALRSWSWHSDDLERELRDAAGTLLARIESDAGRHRLTHPRTWPILSWPDLAEAKHRAESVALSANPKLAARIKRDNETPHPMGPPLNRPPLTGDATSSDWRPTGNGAGVLNIPPFLQRAA